MVKNLTEKKFSKEGGGEKMFSITSVA